MTAIVKRGSGCDCSMILEINKTATVPARYGFGRNQESAGLRVMRMVDETRTLRVVSLLGDFSVWQEGPKEKLLFRINLGVLAEIARRAGNKAWTLRRSLPEIRELRDEETLKVWRACASDPELRFSASLRRAPSNMGGWMYCLELAGMILRMQGRSVPWDDAEFVKFDSAA